MCILRVDANQYYLTWQSYPVDKKLSPTSRQTDSFIDFHPECFIRPRLAFYPRLIDFSIKFQAAHNKLNILYVDTPLFSDSPFTCTSLNWIIKPTRVRRIDARGPTNCGLVNNWDDLLRRAVSPSAAEGWCREGTGALSAPWINKYRSLLIIYNNTTLRTLLRTLDGQRAGRLYIRLRYERGTSVRCESAQRGSRMSSGNLATLQLTARCDE